MDLNYYNTLITVSEDCGADEAKVPEQWKGKPTVASIQWNMLNHRPYEFTQEDVLFESWFQRQPEDQVSDRDVDDLRSEFFSKSRACLRASPLPKTYGWGFHFNDEGKVALVALNSPEYLALMTNPDITIRKGMRSKRA